MALRTVLLVVCFMVILLMTGCLARHRRRHHRASRRRPPLSEFPPRLHAQFATVANNFTWNLYKQLSSGRKNLVFSPVSVFKTVSMVYLGATNVTAKEIFNAVGYEILKRPRKVRKAFRHFAEMMRRPMRNVSFQVADALYVHESIHLRNRFVKRMRKFYKAKIRTYNHNTKNAALSSLKKWIKRNTRGKLNDFKTNLSVKSKRSLLFMNAVYFNGSWDMLFDRTLTNRTMFDVNKHTRADVDMMFCDWRYYYKINPDLKVKVIEIPYDSHRFSFYIILPDEVNGLEELERRLTSTTFQNLITDMKGPARFHLRMPRMNLMSDLDLKPHLKKMGINDVFEKKADMSPIDGTKNLFVDHVMHMSVLDVDEGGSVGSGVTGAGIALRSVPPEFIADRPFMFVIKDKLTKTDLFMGKYSDPRAS
ncbi:leukocyte elastase inhibitor-like [Haliotis rubra]|uniref:leukocyte elastase inhibitor-like n=1 Tax=Haliotis rubra TaxID=36100 RepID=UPI001EE4EFA0|nr:leukocyte elastase inhibitor-like [Haliotis rubra]